MNPWTLIQAAFGMLAVFLVMVAVVAIVAGEYDLATASALTSFVLVYMSWDD